MPLRNLWALLQLFEYDAKNLVKTVTAGNTCIAVLLFSPCHVCQEGEAAEVANEKCFYVNIRGGGKHLERF